MLLGIATLIIIAIVIAVLASMMNNPTRVTATQVHAAVVAGEVSHVNISNDTFHVRFRDRNHELARSRIDEREGHFDVYAFGREISLTQTIYDRNDAILTYAQDANSTIAISVREDLLEQLRPTFTNDGVLDEAALEAEIEARFPNALNLYLFANHLADITFNNRFAVSIWDFLPTIIFIVLLVVMGIFIFKMISSQNKQHMGFSKSKATTQTSSKVRFTDVAGAEEEKVELAEIVDFLKSPAKFKAVGARTPRGVLLVGPPGTGKTLFAKAVAGEAEVPFFSISGSDFVEMFVGVGASRVRDLFAEAKRVQPCIIFIDEIDAVGRQRGAGLGGGHDEREQTLNQLLVQMDGFETSDGIIVMAATNRADILDPALLRPGRFDRQIYVNVPDVRGREAIFKVHARNKPLDPNIDFKSLSRITSGMSGADIANLLNEAAILCARDNRTVINMNDISEGINKATLGPQKKSRVVTEFDKRVTAYHEAGHAIVAKACKSGMTVHEVSIIPRGGGAGGFTRPRPDNDNQMDTQSSFKAHIAMVMGGRAAEAIVIEDITTGASMDIKMATGTARRMVTEWGMSGNKKLGQVNYSSDQEVFLGKSYAQSQSHSESTSAEIDKEVSRLVDEGYQTALSVLNKYRAEMDVMARVLMECETIFTEEIDLIMSGASVETVKVSIDERFAKKAQKVEEAIQTPEQASETEATESV